MATGQGYWIKTTEAKTVAPNGTLTPSVDFTIPLQVGWNQIGNPFDQEVQWSSLEVSSNGGTPVPLASATCMRSYGWGYDPSSGSYFMVDASRPGATTTIEAWQGYWVKALSACNLIIPVPSSSVTQSSVKRAMSLKSVASLSSGDYKWLVNLKAANGTLKDNGSYFGISNSSADSVEKPSPLQNYVDLYFTNSDGSGSFASDIRTAGDGNSKWPFEVLTDTAGDVTLTWDGVDVSGVTFNLVDDTVGKSVVMASGGSYTFHVDQSGAKRSFHITVD
jgi:hypothetical protein